MKPNELILHCYAEKVEDHWQAFCLDFSLAVQGDSYADVSQKLLNMIREYVYDALVGQDKEFAFRLLKREASFRYWAKFYFFVLLDKVGALHDEMRRLFCPPIPLGPSNYKHA